MSRAISIAVVCALACSATTRGDEIHFRNGDRLSGQILRLTEGKLVLKSQFLGEITVNLKDIRTFSSDAPLEIHLTDGTVLRQSVLAAEPNEFAIARGEALRPQMFKLADVASIIALPKPRPKWTGTLSGAVSSTHGNTTVESVTASVKASRRSEKDRTTVEVDYARSDREDPDTGEEETTEDWERAKARYDYFFGKKFFVFGNVRHERDDIARLDRRIVIGGGGGHQWIETEATAFSTDWGLASLYEKFDNQDSSNSEFSFQTGYDFNKRLRKDLRFLHDLTYYPSLENFSDYYFTATGELQKKLTKRLSANFKVIFSYDATPAPDQGGTDVKYLLGVGLNF